MEPSWIAETLAKPSVNWAPADKNYKNFEGLDMKPYKSQTKNERWIQLNCSIIWSSMFKSHHIFKFYIWCLCKSAYKSYTWIWGGKKIPLKKGQFVFSLKKASQCLHMDIKTVIKCCRSLELRKKITREYCPNPYYKSKIEYSIITVKELS